MNFIEDYEESIIEWAEARGILSKNDKKAQLLKTMAELGELADAVTSGDRAEIKDGIGDVLVTLAIQANMQGLTLRECIAYAYREIKDRKGQMINGAFVKEKNNDA
jgi:NTP pyrophosphatase (non-canonical NTP hydrolase)